MNKITFGLILLALSNSVYSDWIVADKKEWVPIAKNTEAAMYYVADSVKSNGDSVAIWFLQDLILPREERGLTFRSMVGQMNMDCKQRLFQITYIVIYSGSMGGGKSLKEVSGASKWKPAAPGSVNEYAINKICYQAS